MSLLYTVIFSTVCRNTHHRLAVDALRHLRGADVERWCDLFLHEYAHYLAGSKAPDDQFKDFRNHVLHVSDNYWGGARQEARRWFDRTIDSLRRREWHEAVYAAGVLSHYFSDPFMPLHTDQCEAETKVHRAVEWSICKSYGRLQQIIEHDQGGYPQVETPQRDDWLERMIATGAELSHEHYQVVLDHYDLAAGVRDPLAGMDQECLDRVAICLGHAVVGFARVLERALAEAAVEPPAVENTLLGFTLVPTIPLRSALNYARDLNERMAIEAIYDEAQRTGKVLKNLPADDREIRKLHAEEVLRIPLHQLDQQPAGMTGVRYGMGNSERHVSNRLDASPQPRMATTAAPAWREAQRRAYEHCISNPVVAFNPSNLASLSRGSESTTSVRLPIAATALALPRNLQPPRMPPPTPVPLPIKALPVAENPRPVAASLTSNKAAAAAPLRFRLQPAHPVVDAPTIGPKAAGRLEKAGIITVSDLLSADPETLAKQLNDRHTTADTIRTWQHEASLACRIPEVYGHDAQLLVASGLTEPAEVAAHSPEELLQLVMPIVESDAGRRILRNQKPPNLAEVTDWIRWAAAARSLQAA